MIDFKGVHYPREVILYKVFFYAWCNSRPVFLFDAIEPEVLEILEGRQMQQHHDEQYLVKAELARTLALPIR